MLGAERKCGFLKQEKPIFNIPLSLHCDEDEKHVFLELHLQNLAPKYIILCGYWYTAPTPNSAINNIFHSCDLESTLKRALTSCVTNSQCAPAR